MIFAVGMAVYALGRASRSILVHVPLDPNDYLVNFEIQQVACAIGGK